MTKATIAIVSIINLPAARFEDGVSEEMLGLAYKKDGELFAVVPMLVRNDVTGRARTDEEMIAAITSPFPTVEDIPPPLFMQLMTPYLVVPACLLTDDGVTVRELGELGSSDLDEDDSEAHGLHIDDIKGKVVRHTCDNVRCVNPEHPVLGTRLNKGESVRSMAAEYGIKQGQRV